MSDVTLTELNAGLRAIAVPAGNLHPYWDLIYDIEAFLRNDPTMLGGTTEMYTKMATRRLADTSKHRG